MGSRQSSQDNPHSFVHFLLFPKRKILQMCSSPTPAFLPHIIEWFNPQIDPQQLTRSLHPHDPMTWIPRILMTDDQSKSVDHPIPSSHSASLPSDRPPQTCSPKSQEARIPAIKSSIHSFQQNATPPQTDPLPNRMVVVVDGGRVFYGCGEHYPIITRIIQSPPLSPKILISSYDTSNFSIIICILPLHCTPQSGSENRSVSDWPSIPGNLALPSSHCICQSIDPDHLSHLLPPPSPRCLH